MKNAHGEGRQSLLSLLQEKDEIIRRNSADLVQRVLKNEECKGAKVIAGLLRIKQDEREGILRRLKMEHGLSEADAYRIMREGGEGQLEGRRRA